METLLKEICETNKQIQNKHRRIGQMLLIEHLDLFWLEQRLKIGGDRWSEENQKISVMILKEYMNSKLSFNNGRDVLIELFYKDTNIMPNLWEIRILS